MIFSKDMESKRQNNSKFSALLNSFQACFLSARVLVTVSLSLNIVQALGVEEGASGVLDGEGERSGAAIFDGVCGQCHNHPSSRAPSRFILSLMSPETIFNTLKNGIMQPMASGLSDDEKKVVAKFLATRQLQTSQVLPPLMCEAEQRVFDYSQPPVFKGWGLGAGNTHSIPMEVAGIDRKNVKQLKLKWALAYPNAVRARSQPAIAGGAIFVGSQDGSVFSLDIETGCARWIFKARAEVRTGIVVSTWVPGNRDETPVIYFGDLLGYVYAVDAANGQQIWSERADSHSSATITAAPALHGGKLYVTVSSLEEGSASSPLYPCCTFRGSVIAYEAGSGKKLWQTFTTDQPVETGTKSNGIKRFGPSGVAIWSTPLVDPARDRIYVVTGNNYSGPYSKMADAVIALNLKDGGVVWSTQATEGDVYPGSCANDQAMEGEKCLGEKGPDYDFGAAPLLAKGTDDREYLLAGQKSGIVWAFDPDNGEVRWKTRVGNGGAGGGVLFGIAADDGKVYVPVHDRPDRPEQVAAGRPGIYAIDISSGKLLWEVSARHICGDKEICYSGYAGAITATPDLVLAGSVDSYLRIFDSASGSVLWTFDTAQQVNTVNGQIASGGSMSGGTAPLAYRGNLIMNSGYYAFTKLQRPGNVLLVFSLE